MDDGTTEMTQAEILAYHRQQQKLLRAAEKELEQRRQSKVTTAPRSAKAKALEDKIWLPAKRPVDSEKEPVVQKKVRTTSKPSKKTNATTDAEERDSEQSASNAKSAPPKAVIHRRRILESDSSSLSGASDDDSNDLPGDDDDSNLKLMSDEQLAKVNAIVIDRNKSPASISNTSRAHRDAPAPSLFDVPDFAVEMASQSRPPSRAPSRASSCASGPPTSDVDENLEEGGGRGIGESNDESEGSGDMVITRRTRRVKPKASKRQEKFEREQPKIKTNPAETGLNPSSKPSRKFEITDADDDAKWPVWTHIVYSGKSKSKVPLLQQHQVIRAILRHAFELAEIDIITDVAWPELKTSREIYRRQIVHRAAKVVERKDSRAKEVKERVKGSMKYSSMLGDLVMDRLSIARSPARASAIAHIACFELGVGVTCQQRVSALVENDLYIYPGSWQIQEFDERNEKSGHIEKRRQSIWVISDRSLIYQNPGFMASLKDAFFDKRGSFGFKYLDHFKSTLEGREEHELTIPIVALGATGFYAALHSWSSGSFNKKEKFEGEIFNTVFERHVKYLEQIKEDNRIAFHVILSRLYTYVTKDVGTSQQSSTSNALGVADLSGYE